MKAYAPYINDLQRLLVERRAEPTFQKLAEAAVNGEASARLTELVSTYSLKRTGAFFTSSELSERAAESLPLATNPVPVLIADPACGAGNLLIAAAKRLPVRKGLTATLRDWGAALAGFDLHPEFVRATHLRLAVLAVARGALFDLSDRLPLASLFPHIRCSDGVEGLKGLRPITHLLVNPPFGPTTAPRNCSWAQGKVTKAAVFFGKYLRDLQPGATISAILPDVLRAGSRYQRWRQMVESRAEVVRVSPIGNFVTADVDVFLLDLRVGGSAKNTCDGRWWNKEATTSSVGDRFHVHVGAVVPHRLKKNEGPVMPYLHAKELPFWGSFKAGAETVSFKGATFTPPFVAVRRTSSPSDRYRALGTVIRGSRPVAVENHLLVCLPKSGGLSECEELLAVLKRTATNTFLNRRIRCRHLTVGVVKEIPW